MEEQTKIESPPVKKSLGRRIWNISRRIILILLGFFFLLVLVFQIPAVQTWAARQATHFLSRKLDTEVSIERISLIFLNRFELHDFYLEDYAQDTLLYSNSLKINLNLNPFALAKNGLQISTIELENAKMNWIRREGQLEGDLERIIGQLFPKKEEKSPPPPLSLRRVNLYKVDFLKRDEVNGSSIHAYLDRAQILMDTFDLKEKIISATAIHLENPVIEIENWLQKPLPDSMQAILDLRKAERNPDTIPFQAAVERLTLSGGVFRLDNYRKDPDVVYPDTILDYRHLDISDIQVGIDEFRYSDFDFQGRVDVIRGKTSSGLVLSRLSAEKVVVSPKTVSLDDLLIVTPKSRITRSFKMNYSTFLDWRDFINRVRMDGDLVNAQVALADIMVFAPKLYENPFFAANKDEVVRLSGRVYGSVNNLRIRNLDAKLSDGTSIKGRFSSNDITEKDQARLNIRLDELSTEMQTLRNLVPGLRLPANFDLLGTLGFTGSYDGFFEDFVANGILETDIGTATLDMRMDLLPGRARAEYTGALSLQNFDLGKWTGDPNFGRVTVSSRVNDGIGLTAEAASASLEANIVNLEYKGYSYQNAQIQGTLIQNRFDGELLIQDDNIDLSFNGKVDLSKEVPEFDFGANIQRMALRELNLTEEEFLFSGKITLDLIDIDPETATGTVALRGIDLVLPQGEQIEIDSLFLRSFILSDSVQTYRFDGNLLSGEVKGTFNPLETPKVVSQLVSENYPEFANRMGIKSDTTVLADQTINFDLSIPESGGFEKLLSRRLGPLDDTRLHGYLNTYDRSLLVDLNIPEVRFDSLKVHNQSIILDVIGEQGGLDLTLDSIQLSKSIKLGRIFVLSLLNDDALLLNVNMENRIDPTEKVNRSILDNVNLTGSLSFLDSTGFRFEFDDSDLFLFQEKWEVNSDNYLEFSSKAFQTYNFVMTNGDQSLEMASIGDRGLRMQLRQLNLDLIDELIAFDPLNFGGRYEVDLQVQDLFKLTDLSLDLGAPDLQINEDNYGDLSLKATAPSIKGKLQTDVILQSGERSLTLTGAINLADLEEGEAILIENQQGYFEFDAELRQFPARFGEYFVPAILEDLTGEVRADVQLTGLPEKPYIEGEVFLDDVAFTVSYLKTRYKVEQGARFTINNEIIDGTGNRLYDAYGHQAVLQGGILHNSLKRFRLGAELDVTRLLVMNTTIEDNPSFYGNALGTGTVQFTGPFKQPNIYINATVGDSSRLVIPSSAGSGDSQLNFVEFVDQEEIKSQLAGKVRQTMELKGLDIEMDLNIQPEAVVEIVFDEQAGDVLRGQGRGNLQINVTRDGIFEMFGNYRISSGSYLFTLYNVVNKQFNIKEGGVIQFSGDPMQAQLDVRAEYSGITASVANFIPEYLQSASPDLKNDASKSTRVNLEMQLTGPLQSPVIGFNIFFPELTGELLNLCESKMRILRKDQNELNRQVFGLIVAGQFLPDDFNIQGTAVFANTVSEFLSNQLSMLLTGLFSEIIDDGSVLSGIDIDVAYSSYQAADLGEGQDYTSGNEFQVRLRQEFFNDRLTVIVGGNIDVGGNITAPDANNGTFIGNDLVIEYTLNQDRTLKLRVYQKLQPDLGGGRRLQLGTGISFRKEYDNFGEFLKSIGRKNRKAKKKRANREEEQKAEDLVGSKQ